MNQVSQNQEWRIRGLETKIDILETEIRRLQDERQQLIGMGNMAKWGIKFVVGLAGFGGVRVIMDVIHWFNAPLGKVIR